MADVRLDNRLELLRQLNSQLPPDISDAQIMSRALDAWGLDAIERFVGDFAFVAYDPGQERLICARDASGQRPLYYRADTHTFAAGSDIHQLLQDPTVPVVPNEDAILDFLTPFNVYRNRRDQANTFYRGVLSLPAGHVLVVTRDRMDLHRYWTLSPATLRYRIPRTILNTFVRCFSRPSVLACAALTRLAYF